MWTDRSLGHPLDLGASWIHGASGNPLTDLARATDARLAETDYSNLVLRNAGGERIPLRSINSRTREIFEVETEYAADAEALSKRAFAEGEYYDGEDFLFPYGYDQLFSALTPDLDIRLSTPVRSVEYSARSARLSTTGSETEFDAVLVTVPLGVLKADDIRFSPRLPREKQDAIKRLGMGLLDKACFKFDRIFWDTEADFIVYSGTNPDRFVPWLNMAKYTGAPVLLAFNAASTAEKLAAQSDAQSVSQGLAVLKAMYPDQLE